MACERSKYRRVEILKSEFILIEAETTSNVAGLRGSNKNLEKIALEKGLDKFLVKNPSQGEEAPRTTLASSVEALIGAVWLDSGRDIEKVHLIIEALGIVGPGTTKGK